MVLRFLRDQVVFFGGHEVTAIRCLSPHSELCELLRSVHCHETAPGSHRCQAHLPDGLALAQARVLCEGQRRCIVETDVVQTASGTPAWFWSATMALVAWVALLTVAVRLARYMSPYGEHLYVPWEHRGAHSYYRGACGRKWCTRHGFHWHFDADLEHLHRSDKDE